MRLIEEAELHCEATKESQDAVRQRLEWLNGVGKVSYIPELFHSPVEKVENPFDLENLRFREPVFDERGNKEILVTPDLIHSFVEEINKLPDVGKAFTIGIGTGGTPSMDQQKTGGSLGTKFNFDGLMKHPKINPQLREEFDILGIDLFKTDSSQLEIDDVGDMTIAMAYIWQNMRPALRERFNGFIVIHGTDTMSKSGAHHATMLGRGMPFNVVHVGAQRTIGHRKTDFPANLEDAFRTIGILHRSGLAECVTVMGRKALLTVGTNKISGERLDAMISPRHRELLDFTKHFDPERYTLKSRGIYRRKDSQLPFEPVVYRGPNRILTISAEMSEDPTAIMASIRLSAAKAILMVPYQSGTFDAKAVEWMDRFAKRYSYTARAEQEAGKPRPHDIPIFAVHPADEYTDLQRYDAALTELQAAGVVAVNMTENALRAKLMRALATCDESKADYKQQLTKTVLTNLIGESSYAGERYLDRFDPIDVSELEEIIAGKEGEPCTADISFGGSNAGNQIRGMAETDFRGANLSHVVPINDDFLLAHTTFWNELLDALDDFSRSHDRLRRSTPAWIEADQQQVEEMNRPINEGFIPRLNAILNNAEAARDFMEENGIEINISNQLQLRDEILFVWSQLTGNNLIFTRNSSGGPTEKYVPLSGPDENGIIRRIDHEKRFESTTLSFLEAEND